METLLIWSAVIIPSILWGGCCSFIIKSKYSGFLSWIIPWFTLLAFILYSEYFTPYQGGGASMWPIALLVGGTVAAVIGHQSYKFFLKYVKSH